MAVAEHALAVLGPLDEAFDIPVYIEFGDAEFMEDRRLEEIGLRLIDRYTEEFFHLRNMSVRYFWRKEGGSAKGKLTMGKCEKPTGLLRDLSGADFHVWLAADNCEGFTTRNVEALIYHELRHTSVTVKGAPSTVGHDVETFESEVLHYGLWRNDLKRLGATIRQLTFEDVA